MMTEEHVQIKDAADYVHDSFDAEDRMQSAYPFLDHHGRMQVDAARGTMALLRSIAISLDETNRRERLKTGIE